MYLWNRKFGTAEYRAGPFARFIDRQVARVVGYDKARANYMLCSTRSPCACASMPGA